MRAGDWVLFIGDVVLSGAEEGPPPCGQAGRLGPGAALDSSGP